MSNETKPQTEQVHNVTSVGTDVPVETPVAPKKQHFIRTRNVASKTTATVKKHKNTVLLAVGATAGAVAVTLLNSQKKDDEVIAEDETTTDETPNLTLLESYSD